VLKTRNIFFLLLFLTSFCVQAQNVTNNKLVLTDSLKGKFSRTNRILNADTFKLKPFKPDPLKVVWMAAIIPGYGQIMNKKYWKLPIVYGGFLGCAYAVSWNSGMYQTYQTAYRDILTTNDPTATSYLQLLPAGRTINDYGGITAFTSILKSKQDIYYRYRDLSIIATVAYYALTIVDAFVDAQLYDFDISPDLSLRLQPTLMKNDFGVTNTLAMQCSISLK
jgi:hypothetical protein